MWVGGNMAIPFLDFLTPIISKALDFIPDPKLKAETQLKITSELNRNREEILKALTAVDIAQANVNAVDAASSDKYRSWARPTAMWVCVLGLLWQIVAVMGTQFAVWFGYPPPQIILLPEYITNTLLFGLLGLTGARSVDLWNGARK